MSLSPLKRWASAAINLALRGALCVLLVLLLLVLIAINPGGNDER